MDSVNRNPGPGDYETVPVSPSNKGLNNSARKTQFGSSERFLSSRGPAPAPGDYQISPSKGLVNHQGKFGTGPKYYNSPNEQPGPG
jgi:hypothetical protein